MLILTSLQRIHAGENLEENESPTLYVGGGGKLAIVSAMDTLQIPETNFREIRRSKGTCTLTKTEAQTPITKTDNQQNLQEVKACTKCGLYI